MLLRVRTFAAAAAFSAGPLVAAVSAFGQTAPPAPPADANAADTEAPSAFGGGSPGTQSPPARQQGVPSAARSPSPPASPWKPLFFENDFSAYVGEDPDVFGEELKQLPLDLPGDDFDFTLDVGGQVRHRYHDESNRLVPGGPGDNSYQLWRWRQYYDLKNDYVRFYAETIEADQFGEELPATPIDVNRFDLLNAFVDLNLYESDYGAGTFRYGRQELLYGKQRLVSPLDWSNTRRNFEGAKFWHVGDGWRFDAFAVNPVNPVARGGVDFERYDSQPDEADRRRTLFGGYLALTADPERSIDVYMLYQDDERARPDFAEGDRGLNGARVYGVVPADACGRRAWDYDLEGGYQWGSDLGERVSAGFATAELGHTWKKAAWQPRVAGLVYWGSGGGPADTFYAYYPLGHAYWGILDNLSGQNLIDVGPQFSLNPTKKLNLTGAYHYFAKADADGLLYNVAQVPVGPAGVGSEIGQEVDLVGTYTFNPNLSVQAGYAHFWYGRAVETAIDRDTAELFYLMTTFNY